MYTVAKRLYQQIYIIAAPLLYIGKFSRISSEGLLIIYFLTFNFIGIKIIVHMYAINIVIVNHVQDNLNNIVAHFGYAGVKQFNTSIGKKPARHLVSNMLPAQTLKVTVESSPIWV